MFSFLAGLRTGPARAARPRALTSRLRFLSPQFELLEARLCLSTPQVTLNPAPQSAVAGTFASFVAAANGTPAPTLQWQVSTDGGASFNTIAGATANTFTFQTSTGQNGNEYQAVFTNVDGTATTTAATLLVHNVAPTIAVNPTSQNVVVGASVAFSAAANGTPKPTVQWQVSTDGGVSFVNVPTATNPTLNFQTSIGQNGNEYQAVFTNAAGSVTTTAATLSVHNVAPVTTSDPSSVDVVVGVTAAFFAHATGTPTPTAQWQVSTNGGATFTNIAGATGTSLTVPTTLALSGNEYQAVFTNAAGSATTAAAVLTVHQVAPVISVNPVSQDVVAGSNATFEAQGTGVPTPTVQWQVSTDGGTNFANVTGATQGFFSFSTTLAQNGNQYRAVFTNPAGTAATSSATLLVHLIAPTITINPTSSNVTLGTPVTLTAVATGIPTPTVQWQLSTDSGAHFSNFAGATATTFSFPTTISQNGNQYRAVFTNPAGTATTSVATLNVHFVAPVVVANPTSQTAFLGSPAEFIANATGVPQPTVQWQVSTNGGKTFKNIAGATSRLLSFVPTLTQSGAQYRAVFTNAGGSATTFAANLLVLPRGVSTGLTIDTAALRAFEIEAAVLRVSERYFEDHYKLVSASDSSSKISGLISANFTYQAHAFQTALRNPHNRASETRALLQERLSLVDTEASAFQSLVSSAQAEGLPDNAFRTELINFGLAVESQEDALALRQVEQAHSLFVGTFFVAPLQPVFPTTFFGGVSTSTVINGIFGPVIIGISLVPAVRPISRAYQEAINILNSGFVPATVIQTGIVI